MANIKITSNLHDNQDENRLSWLSDMLNLNGLTNTEIQYFSNNGLIGTIAKTISDSQLLMTYFYIANQVAGAIRNIDMDYFKLTTRFTNR